MKIILLGLVLTSTIAQAKCMAPKFETECIKAKVGEKLEPEADIPARNKMDADPKWNWTCRRKVSVKGYDGDAYIISKDTKCPETGMEIFGNLNVPCNDDGQNTPVFFQIKAKKECRRN